jgi:hypothetical protein
VCHTCEGPGNLYYIAASRLDMILRTFLNVRPIKTTSLKALDRSPHRFVAKPADILNVQLFLLPVLRPLLNVLLVTALCSGRKKRTKTEQ